MQICVLTELQAHLFEHKGILPECCNLNRERRRAGLHEVQSHGGHIHLQSYAQAVRIVGADQGDNQGRWVIGPFAIAYNSKRGWNSKRSGAVRTMQMTRETSSFRHAGQTKGAIEARGAHGRNTSVLATNTPQPTTVVSTCTGEEK